MDNSNQLHIDKSSFIPNRKENILNYYNLDPIDIGRGAYGVVFQAQKKDSGEQRAIKKITKKFIKNIDLLHNQMTILKALDHPGIVKLHQIFEDEKNLYLVLDLCLGGQLFDRLAEEGSFSQKEAKHLFLQIIEAIYYCHENKIAHRDLKPENFMFNSKSSLEMSLIDFGLSYPWKSSMREELLESGQNKLIGTAYYIAPEVIKGNYDEKCDIWSAGVILYTLVTAMFPFDGEDNKQILSRVSSGNYAMNIPQITRLSPQLRDLIKKILQPQKTRITLQEVFHHPWLAGEPSDSHLKLNFSRMQSYASYSKFKKVIANCIATQFSESQVEELGILFKQIDLNHDGYIQVEQLQQILQKQKQSKSLYELLRLMQQIDVDGRINYTQFLAFSIEEGRLFRRENLKRIFQMMDMDHNGKVDRHELETMLKKYNWIWFNSGEVDEIMGRCDRDGDGLIDLNEFIEGMK